MQLSIAEQVGLNLTWSKFPEDILDMYLLVIASISKQTFDTSAESLKSWLSFL